MDKIVDIHMHILPGIDDGAKNMELTVGDTVLIKKFDKKVQLVNCTADKFYTALRSKLNWSGGPHA